MKDWPSLSNTAADVARILIAVLLMVGVAAYWLGR